jgi:hypothetical protein
MAPVPEEWGHFLIDSSYKFITTLSSNNQVYTVAARHTSGEVCSIKKYEGVGMDVGVPQLFSCTLLTPYSM